MPPARGASAAAGEPHLLSEGSLPSSTTGTEDAHADARGAAADEPARSSFAALFSAVMLPMFMGAVDQTLLVTATPRIAAELGGLAQTSWIAAGYLLASTVMAPLYGRLGDRFGRRNVMLVALVMFALGSLACALAPSLRLLVAARVLQGLGGGGLMVLSQALIGELVPPWDRPRYQGYFAVIFTTSSVGGPLIGGFVVHHGDWRWLFLANLPLAALAFWRMSLLPRPHPSAQRHAPYDPLGFVLFALCAASALVWFGQVGHGFALVSLPSALIAAAALGTGVALALQQRRHANAFLPLDILRLPGVPWVCASVAGFAGTLFGLLFLLPIYLQVALRANALDAGLQLLPLTAGIVVGSTLNGRYSARTGTSGRLPPFGLALAALAILALALLPPLPGVITPAAALCGVGFGTVMPNAQLATQILAGRQRLGAAAALLSLTRSSGATLGTAAFGGLAFVLLGSSEGSLQVGQLEPARVMQAFHIVFGVLAGFAALGAFAAWRAPRMDLRAHAERGSAPTPALPRRAGE
ncbi:MFS transporter [Ramlibacter monticola]|uniref:MFS transporter n=1 Tax=Ramlibacter monticola TaxID=1926872 RepID=A0A936YXV3_9BURK|nr:MFS transporter [Ramlibacter monticola]MBL0390898.1 MFS transporter [Ramlibacter monticola]